MGDNDVLLRREAFPVSHRLPEQDCTRQGSFLFGGDYFLAFQYLQEAMLDEMQDRTPNLSRRDTFFHRMNALFHLYNYIEHPPVQRPMKLEQWSTVHHASLVDRQWSPEQAQVLKSIADLLAVSDANDVLESNRMLFVSGEPGSGKSEVLVHAAVRAAKDGCYVLILCPTGTLVHSYRDRLPASERIVIETIHSGLCITRQADLVVQYSPPNRLRRYDLILLDEASQVEDHVAQKIFVAIKELPQKPAFIIAADFRQLRPVAGGGIMRRVCDFLPAIELKTVYRTKDPEMLKFLGSIRKKQPDKSALRSFFDQRLFTASLPSAVGYGLAYAQQNGVHFSWLCVTNAGAEKVNAAALSLLGISQADTDAGLLGDPKVGAGRIVMRRGLYLRLTRNLDKDRGFVNGAIGVIEHVLDPSHGVCLLRLTTGTLVLVHPVVTDRRVHLPCAYGYATTIRRAQGASLDAGCLYFDHCYPPERGYAYVGASRFRTKGGLFHFGRLRRTDWLPVDGDPSLEQTIRGRESESEDEFDDQDAELDADYASSEDAEIDRGDDSDDEADDDLCFGLGAMREVRAIK